ncbi:hypothetical protein FSARC_7650 [Fusarium sarcochroum]|uniref:Uncharacterized protein n=1 Tax=Fusarium sarcochroum TaxID=1208366 RepID=A0A8H4X7S0_9HYPO|nr:hypothetical protein FSARC_7650 [Fusarium sarcochroum]
MDLELQKQAELQNTFLLQRLRWYLRGHALQWFEEERLGDKTFEEIIPLFDKKFSTPNTAEDGKLIITAHQLARNRYESMQILIILQLERGKIIRRENTAAERTSTERNGKDHYDGISDVSTTRRLSTDPPEQLALDTMLRYDGAGFTRLEADYSKPWLPAIEALQQAEMTDHSTRGTPTDALGLRAIELWEEEQPLPSGPQHIDVEMAQNIPEDEFDRLLPHLQPHRGRLNLQSGVVKAVLTTEKNARVRDWTTVGRAKDQHQRVIVATNRSVHRPTVIETHAMPAKSGTTKTKEAPVNMLAPLKERLKPELSAELEEEARGGDRDATTWHTPERLSIWWSTKIQPLRRRQCRTP